MFIFNKTVESIVGAAYKKVRLLSWKIQWSLCTSHHFMVRPPKQKQKNRKLPFIAKNNWNAGIEL